MVKLNKYILILLFVIFGITNGLSQRYPYQYLYDWTNRGASNNNLSIELLSAVISDGIFILEMQFINKINNEILLIKPDTSMLETANVIIQIFTEKNSNRNFRIHLNGNTSQLAYFTIDNKEEMLELLPGIPLKYTLCIPIERYSKIPDRKWKDYRVKMILDYEETVISSLELINLFLGVIESNIINIDIKNPFSSDDKFINIDTLVSETNCKNSLKN